MAMPFTVRLYEPSDAPQMTQRFFDSARTLGARRYSPVQVAAWAPAPADPARVHARASDGRITLVAAILDTEVLGYGDLEADGHIDHLYCRPDAAGTGVTPAIPGALIATANEAGIRRLDVEASDLARGLFEGNASPYRIDEISRPAARRSTTPPWTDYRVEPSTR